MYDALTSPVHVRVPAPRRDARARCRRSGGSSGCPARASRRLPRRVRVRLRRTSTPASSPTTSSTGRRSASGAGVLPQPHDRAASSAVAGELGDLAARRIGAGEWPWSFFCYPEERPRPVFPSAFFLLAPGERAASASPCAAPPARGVSVNLVSLRARRLAVPQRPPGRVSSTHVFSDDARQTSRSSRPSSTPPVSTRAASLLD